MSERAFEDVAEDFHIPMRMGREPHARGDDIVVDDAQAAKAHVGGIEVIGEAEGVESFEPAVVGVSAFLCVPDENFIGWGDAFHGLMMRHIGGCDQSVELKVNDAAEDPEWGGVDSEVMTPVIGGFACIEYVHW